TSPLPSRAPTRDTTLQRLFVCLWIVWRFHSLHVAAFNLDIQNVQQRKGDPGSLFGFSVAFHQQLNPARRNLLLVGAPRAKHQSGLNVTGVVYQCDLASTSEQFLNSKGINNQWMGVRVVSQGPGKNVMVRKTLHLLNNFFFFF
uniref:Integrin alpha-2 domain-containing protein n=1 Tax=Stegastes partitus TaxID=144197 RepID=A0A3B4Z6X8_9TELE